MNTKDMVYVALFAAVVAVLGLIPKIHLAAGVPITAQSMGVMLAGGILGARRGGLALLVFVLLVFVGLPLMSGGRGGLGLLVGPSGGFIIGFPICAFIIGWLSEKYWDRLTLPVSIVINCMGGIALLYAIGVPWMTIAGSFEGNQAIALMLPFVPGDIIKAVLAAMAIVAVKRAYPIIRPATVSEADSGAL